MSTQTEMHNHFLPQPLLIFKNDINSKIQLVINHLEIFEDLFWKLVLNPLGSITKANGLSRLFSEFIETFDVLSSDINQFLYLIDIIFSSALPSKKLNSRNPIPLYTALQIIVGHIPGDENDKFCKSVISMWKKYDTYSTSPGNPDQNSSFREDILISDRQLIQGFLCSLLPCMCWTYLTRTNVPPDQSDLSHLLIKCSSLQEYDSEESFRKEWEIMTNIDKFDDFDRENYIGLEELLIFFAKKYTDEIARGSFKFINIQSAHTPWSTGHYLPSILNKASIFIKKLLSTRISTLLTKKEILQRYEAGHERLTNPSDNSDPSKSQQNHQPNAILTKEIGKHDLTDSSSSSEVENYEISKSNSRNKSMTEALQIIDSPLPSNWSPNYDDDPSDPFTSTEFMANVPYYPIRSAYSSNQIEIIKRCVGIFHSFIDVILQRKQFPRSQIPSNLLYYPYKYPIALHFAHFSYAIFSPEFLPFQPISLLIPRKSPDEAYIDTRTLSSGQYDFKTSISSRLEESFIQDQIGEIATSSPFSPSFHPSDSLQASELTTMLKRLVEEDPINCFQLLEIEADPWKTGKQRLQVDDPLLMEIGLTLGLLHHRVFLFPICSRNIPPFLHERYPKLDELFIHTKEAIEVTIQHGKFRSEFDLHARAYWCFAALLEHIKKYPKESIESFY